ncbi:zinc finger MYM-type protein 1-like, partial [Aphis craccivora]
MSFYLSPERMDICKRKKGGAAGERDRKKNENNSDNFMSNKLEAEPDLNYNHNQTKEVTNDVTGIRHLGTQRTSKKPKYTLGILNMYLCQILLTLSLTFCNASRLMQHVKKSNISPLEIAKEIDNNLNPKKSPGYDEISPKILKELPKKA